MDLNRRLDKSIEFAATFDKAANIIGRAINDPRTEEARLVRETLPGADLAELMARMRMLATAGQKRLPAVRAETRAAAELGA
jgi:hypothetical protein